MDENALNGLLTFSYISAAAGTMKNVVLSVPRSRDNENLKIKYTLVYGRDSVQVRGEYFRTEGRICQKNYSTEDFKAVIGSEICGYMRADLNDSGGSASLMVSKKGKITLVSHGKIGEGEKNISSAMHEKKYILSGSEPFLVLLEISDKNGRVHDKKQGKFRQINRFLEMVGDIEKYLPQNGGIRIADLCCGKSYLSFAVYYYFTVVRKRSVYMDCVDLKKSVMEYCRDTAEKLGFDGMHFSWGDISAYNPDKRPHLVISLHACDTATDIVLDAGIRCEADVILSTPCCHRQLSREIECDELKFVTRYPMLKYKLCDALTDGLRLLRLETCGYECSALELVDPEDTPKNILLRAFRRKGIGYKTLSLSKQSEYETAYKYLTGKDAPALPGKEDYGKN